MVTPEGIFDIGNQKVEILIPSRRQDGQLLDEELVCLWDGKARQELDTLFGGCTPTTVDGSFVHADDGRVTRERIVKLTSSCEMEKIQDKGLQDQLFEFAKKLCKALGQEKIFIGWGNSSFLIEEKFDNSDVSVIRYKNLSNDSKDKFLTLGWGGIDSPGKIRQVLSLDGWTLDQNEGGAPVNEYFKLAAKLIEPTEVVRRAWVFNGELSDLASKKKFAKHRDILKAGDLVFSHGESDYILFGLVTNHQILGPKKLQQSQVRLNPVTGYFLNQILKRDWDGLMQSLAEKTLDRRFFPLLQKLRENVQAAIEKNHPLELTEETAKEITPKSQLKKRKAKERITVTSQAFRQSVLLTGRMMFLRFLAQKKGWLEGGSDALIEAFDSYKDDYFSQYIAPLWFDVLNVPEDKRSQDIRHKFQGNYAYLNGGLFNPSKNERDIRLPGTLFDPREKISFLRLFRDYEYSLNEYAGSDDTLKIDPSFFGKALEGFNSSDEKKNQGVHYTPKAIARTMAAEGIIQRLSHLTGIRKKELMDALSGVHKALTPQNAKKVQKAFLSFRIFDPAVGSGVLLWACLTVLLDLDSYCDGIIAGNNGYEPGSGRWGERSRHFVINSLYGTDISDEAIELCRLRLWLAVALSENIAQPLPDLELNIGKGDSLLMDFSPEKQLGRNSKNLKIEFEEQDRLENENLRLWREFSTTDSEEPVRQKQIRNEILAIRAKLAKIDPANYGASGPIQLDLQYPHVFSDQKKLGFDLVIANPPYIRTQNIEKKLKVKYCKRWPVLGEGSSDLLYAFIELALKRLAAPDHGQIAFIQTNFRHLDAADKLRKLLSGLDKDCSVKTQLWVDFNDVQVFPTATNYVAMLFAERLLEPVDPQPFEYSNPPKGSWENSDDLEWIRKPELLKQEPSTEWLTIPKDLKNRVLKATGESKQKLGDLVEISVGIQTSADDILLFDSHEQDKGKSGLFWNSKNETKVPLEWEVMRRCCKGSKGDQYYLLFPYDSKGNLLPESEIKLKFPLAWDYLLHNKKPLEAREKGKFKGNNWYQFGRSQGFAACNIPKVVVPAMLKSASCFLDENGNLAFTASGKGGGGAWALIPKASSGMSLHKIAEIMEQPETWDHILAYGSPQQGGWRGVDRHVIASIPVID